MTFPKLGRTQLLVRPSLDTRFHIDFEWWERANQDWMVDLRSHLCPEHQVLFADLSNDAKVDHVDPETAEVVRVSGIQHVLITHCSLQPDFVTPHTSLINALLRTFLATGNTPQTPRELGQRIGRPPEMILRTLSGPRVYKGIRPYTGD